MSASKLLTIAAMGAGLMMAACSGQPSGKAPAAAVDIQQAWARTTPAGAKTGAGYLVITAKAADRLLGATSSAADKVELHESAMEGMVMTMRPVEPVDLAPGQALTLAPGGKHLMFTGLKTPFVAGAHVPVTLRFEKAGDQTVDLVVRDTAPQ